MLWKRKERNPEVEHHAEQEVLMLLLLHLVLGLPLYQLGGEVHKEQQITLCLLGIAVGSVEKGEPAVVIGVQPLQHLVRLHPVNFNSIHSSKTGLYAFGLFTAPFQAVNFLLYTFGGWSFWPVCFKTLKK